MIYFTDTKEPKMNSMVQRIGFKFGCGWRTKNEVKYERERYLYLNPDGSFGHNPYYFDNNGRGYEFVSIGKFISIMIRYKKYGKVENVRCQTRISSYRGI